MAYDVLQLMQVWHLMNLQPTSREGARCNQDVYRAQYPTWVVSLASIDQQPPPQHHHNDQPTNRVTWDDPDC
jgi:hypothetical protein